MPDQSTEFSNPEDFHKLGPEILENVGERWIHQSKTGPGKPKPQPTATEQIESDNENETKY